MRKMLLILYLMVLVTYSSSNGVPPAPPVPPGVGQTHQPHMKPASATSTTMLPHTTPRSTPLAMKPPPAANSAPAASAVPAPQVKSTTVPAESSPAPVLHHSGISATHPMRVAFQGETGAYSEKAARELLGPRIVSLPYESFEDAFKAVASGEVDYAVVPIENSLGGSIHTNYDLLLRYDLHIIAEHEFRVEHSLLALPGTKRENIRKVMSHPQALAQCDNYLRQWDAKYSKVARESTYDTAGSAKMIREKGLVDCAAIASDLAAQTYGLEVLDTNIEDHDNNFTRFLLLARQPVSSLIPANTPAKTSIVFVLPNNPGALYKALACFSLRDIDFCKIESRPTSVKLLQFLQFQMQNKGARKESEHHSGVTEMMKFKGSGAEFLNSQDLPRFRYTFYLDFLASEFDDRAQNALLHLREQSHFVRVLGSYPKGSTLLGPVKSALDKLSKIPVTTEYPSVAIASARNKPEPLKIGIIGFGKFGQFLAKTFVKNHNVYAVDKDDMTHAAKEIGCEFFPLYDISPFLKIDCDVIIMAVSIISFEEVLRILPKEMLRGKLIVDVLSVKAHAKKTMLNLLPEECDVLCTHPMFGPESGKYGWQGLPFLYDKVRVSNYKRYVYLRDYCYSLSLLTFNICLFNA